MTWEEREGRKGKRRGDEGKEGGGNLTCRRWESGEENGMEKKER